MSFTKAIDLVKKIQDEIELHGEDLEVAFYLDKSVIESANSSVVGAVKIDGVEHTTPCRLDLTYL